MPGLPCSFMDVKLVVYLKSARQYGGLTKFERGQQHALPAKRLLRAVLVIPGQGKRPEEEQAPNHTELLEKKFKRQ